MIRNLLPVDCREAELASSGALLLTAAYIACTGSVPVELSSIHTYPFWALLLAALGLLQFATLLLHPKLELAQSVTALCSGSWWIWFFFVTFNNNPHFSALALGFSNLYAFSIGFLFLKKSWQTC